MEILIALGIGLATAGGVYLVLRPRTFSIILGFALLSYAVNVFIFLGGGVKATKPPIVGPDTTGMADPLPQALVLTAIVIGFAMTAYLVALMLRAKSESGTEHVDGGKSK